MTAPSRALAVAVHRPLAEQLVAVAALRGGESVLELTAGDGELGRALRARDATIALTVVGVVEREPLHLPFADGAFDAALSLLALDGGDTLPAALHEVARVARRARIVVWEDGAVHENALRAAWLDAAEAETPPVRGPVAPAAPPPGWSRGALADVARFDSARQLMTALLGERCADIDAPTMAALLARFEERLAEHIAADGTLRIPVRAGVLALG